MRRRLHEATVGGPGRERRGVLGQGPSPGPRDAEAPRRSLTDKHSLPLQTPFTIMFGPDKCGATNKVHFIFRHRNPVTGEYEEKHLEATPSPKITKTTALYTLIVK